VLCAPAAAVSERGVIVILYAGQGNRRARAAVVGNPSSALRSVGRKVDVLIAARGQARTFSEGSPYD